MENTITFEEMLEKNGSLAYTNVGISMRPLIREGKDIMHIKRADGEIKKYDVVLFVRPHLTGRGRYILHRVLKTNNDGSYWIVGDNCLDGENVLRKNIIGVLDSVIRNSKTIKVSDFSYRLYVTFWCAPYKLRFFLMRTKLFTKRVLRKLRTISSGR